MQQVKIYIETDSSSPKASENQCERCEEERHDKKTETLVD